MGRSSCAVCVLTDVSTASEASSVASSVASNATRLVRTMVKVARLMHSAFGSKDALTVPSDETDKSLLEVVLMKQTLLP